MLRVDCAETSLPAPAAARTFFKLLNDGKGTVSYGAGASLRINANVMGLGPAFVVALVLQNTGEKTVRSLHMAINYDAAVYDVAPSVIPVPLLVPGSLYTFEVDVRALEPAAPPKVGRTTPAHPAAVHPIGSVPLATLSAHLATAGPWHRRGIPQCVLSRPVGGGENASERVARGRLRQQSSERLEGKKLGTQLSSQLEAELEAHKLTP